MSVIFVKRGKISLIFGRRNNNHSLTLRSTAIRILDSNLINEQVSELSYPAVLHTDQVERISVKSPVFPEDSRIIGARS